MPRNRITSRRLPTVAPDELADISGNPGSSRDPVIEEYFVNYSSRRTTGAIRKGDNERYARTVALSRCKIGADFVPNAGGHSGVKVRAADAITPSSRPAKIDLNVIRYLSNGFRGAPPPTVAFNGEMSDDQAAAD